MTRCIYVCVFSALIGWNSFGFLEIRGTEGNGASPWFPFHLFLCIFSHINQFHMIVPLMVASYTTV